MSFEETIINISSAARDASRKIAACTAEQKNSTLIRIAEKLRAEADFIKSENAKDLAKGKEAGLTSAMLDRLAITDKTIDSMAEGLMFVARLEDPVGMIVKGYQRPNGLEVSKVRIPLGVIGIIYESRPNVTIDAAGLCLKAGNAVVLRGGSEAINSNRALAGIIGKSLEEEGLPTEVIQVVPVTDREAVTFLLQQEEYIDVIIPRGGEGLIRFVTQNSRIPVLKHYKGVCHTYVDSAADLEMAGDICFNAKVQRPGVCNAMETMLVHKDVAGEFLPVMAKKLVDAGVELRGCDATCNLVGSAKPAQDEDWDTEYVDLILSVKVVDDLDGAIGHIMQYGSKHSDAIVSKDHGNIKKFVREVDSSGVFVNSSTRFNDGGELGLGAEIGISTSKLHAFGPMGLEELTAVKFVVYGDGQIRE